MHIYYCFWDYWSFRRVPPDSRGQGWFRTQSDRDWQPFTLRGVQTGDRRKRCFLEAKLEVQPPAQVEIIIQQVDPRVNCYKIEYQNPPGVYTLIGNRVTPVFQATHELIVVSDLDDTLVCKDNSLEIFQAEWQARYLFAPAKLIYNTGRSLPELKTLVSEVNLIQPDTLILCSGTQIWRLAPENEEEGGAPHVCQEMASICEKCHVNTPCLEQRKSIHKKPLVAGLPVFILGNDLHCGLCQKFGNIGRDFQCRTCSNPCGYFLEGNHLRCLLCRKKEGHPSVGISKMELPPAQCWCCQVNLLNVENLVVVADDKVVCETCFVNDPDNTGFHPKEAVVLETHDLESYRTLWNCDLIEDSTFAEMMSQANAKQEGLKFLARRQYFRDFATLPDFYNGINTKLHDKFRATLFAVRPDGDDKTPLADLVDFPAQFCRFNCAFQEALGETCRLSYTGGDSHMWIDIMPKAAGKGRALNYLLHTDEADIPQELIMCGDGGNDIDMLNECAGTFVLMAQAEAFLRDIVFEELEELDTKQQVHRLRKAKAQVYLAESPGALGITEYLEHAHGWLPSTSL